MPVETKTHQTGKHMVVSLIGQVDMYSVAALRKELTGHVDNGIPSLVINMKDLNYMDSSGIALLATLQKRMKTAGGAFSLLAVPTEVLNVLKLASLDKYFRIVNAVEELG